MALTIDKVAGGLNMATPMPDVRRTFDVAEAAAIIGISKGACYAAVRKGEIRGVRLGRRWVIPRSELDRILGDSHRDGGAEEPGPVPG